MRRLRQQAKNRRASELTARKHVRCVKRRRFAAWREVLGRWRQQDALCRRIHAVKVAHRVLRAWHEHAVVRVEVAAGRVAALRAEHCVSWAVSSWRRVYSDRQRQIRVATAMHLLTLGQVWRAWLRFLRQERRIRRFCEGNRVCSLHGLFSQWVRKVR